MKVTIGTLCILVASLVLSMAGGFSAVAPPSTPKTTSVGGIPNLDPVDKTMEGIDTSNVFDPTDGDNAAVKRNNNEEVWVQQVRVKKK
jgi:hypothetical protein